MKFLVAFSFLVMGSVLGLVAWDNFYGSLNFLPEKFRELNIFDITLHPLFLFIAGLCMAYIGRERIKKKIAAGNAIGSVSCQRLELSAIHVPVLEEGEESDVYTLQPRLLLTWTNTGAFTPAEIIDICGSDVATTALTRDFESAIPITSLVAPIFKSIISVSAFARVLDRYCSSVMSHSGDSRPFILVLAAEDPAQVKCMRVFQIPPAMLLLFYGEFDYSQIVTVRMVQSYRAMALRILAQQLLRSPVELSAWADFESGVVFAVRDLPAGDVATSFDWWNGKWNLDPRIKYSKSTLLEKREALISALHGIKRPVYHGPHHSVSGPDEWKVWGGVFAFDFLGVNEDKRPDSFWF